MRTSEIRCMVTKSTDKKNPPELRLQHGAYNCPRDRGVAGVVPPIIT